MSSLQEHFFQPQAPAFPSLSSLSAEAQSLISLLIGPSINRRIQDVPL